jgi:hypothetical protein
LSIHEELISQLYRSSPEIDADESNAATASCDCLGSAETRILLEIGVSIIT